MPGSLDPYRDWFGLPPGERPPDYYRLLGVRRFEKRAEVIEAAADARVAAVRAHETGENASAAARLLAEIHAARLCLLNDNRRAAYDIGLLQKVAATVAEEEKGVAGAQVTAAEFLAILAQRDLVPGELMAAIRKQMADARSYVTARHIGKLLVDKGVLTPMLVNRLLETARAASEGDAARSERLSQTEPEELALAPLDDEPKQSDRAGAKTPPPIASAATIRASGDTTKLPRHPAFPAAAGSPLRDVELQSLADISPAGPLDELLSDPSFQAAAGAGSPLLTALPRHHKPRFWTTPGFLIGAAVVWVLLLIGAMLAVVMNRPSDEESQPADGETSSVSPPRNDSSPAISRDEHGDATDA